MKDEEGEGKKAWKKRRSENGEMTKEKREGNGVFPKWHNNKNAKKD